MNLRIKHLISSYYNGTLDGQDAMELASWVSASEGNAVLFKEELSRLESSCGSEGSEEFLNSFNDSRKDKAKARRIHRVKVYASVSAGLCASAFVIAAIVQIMKGSLYEITPAITENVVSKEIMAHIVAKEEPVEKKTEINSGEEQIYSASKTSRMSVKLSDGTSIVLNRGAVLKIDRSFGRNDRTVSLEGEAFFDVAKNPAKPFRILCGDDVFVVKGTSFNILSDRINKFSVVTLHTGSLAANIKNDILTLAPGDELRVDDSENVISRQRVDIRKSTKWMEDDALHFSSLPMKVVAARIGERYDVKIHIHPSLSDILYDGVIDDESLEDALRLLAITAPEKLLVDKFNEKDYYITKK